MVLGTTSVAGRCDIRQRAVMKSKSVEYVVNQGRKICKKDEAVQKIVDYK